MSRQKIDLLGSARRRGLAETLRHVARSGRDTLISKRQMCFLIDLDMMWAPKSPRPEGLEFRRIHAWSDLAPENRRLLETVEGVDWGGFDWLDEKGYGLWVGEIEGRLVVTKWWRHTHQAQDFFVPAPEGTELHWQTAVMPAFRGARILDHVLYTVMDYRRTEGVRAFIASCRDFNATTRRYMARAGWTYLGYGVTPKRLGTPFFRPARPVRLVADLEGMATEQPARLARGAAELAELSGRHR